ncbi:MAG: glycosyltransferase family 9 protein [Deltaproteobacteria bacterium]|nr:glycosyltransferase family 9 protein [Deltaproteobacteria bacterium]
MLQHAVKRLEVFARRLGAHLAAALLGTSGPRALAPARLGAARKVLLVRTDNRVGEALLTTPLLDALRAQRPDLEVDLLVHARCVRVLERHPSGVRVLPLDRTRLWSGPFAPGVRALARQRYDLVVDCSNWTAPSVTAALVSRLVGREAVVTGPGVGAVRGLRDIPVEPLAGTRSEVLQRLHLLSPLLGPQPLRPLSFRSPAPSPEVEAFSAALGAGPRAVVNPGGRMGYRRVSPALFAAAANALSARGISPVLTWGPGEEGLADEVQSLGPGIHRAPPTSLDDLAWLMATSALSVCNNTGPMHLSVAVGTPTLGLFLHMDMARWGHPSAPHHMVDVTGAVLAGTGERAVLDALGAWLPTLQGAGPHPTT